MLFGKSRLLLYNRNYAKIKHKGIGNNESIVDSAFLQCGMLFYWLKLVNNSIVIPKGICYDMFVKKCV